jgi:tripartite-type tricarboxylate transporter receptor subunit TctC
MHKQEFMLKLASPADPSSPRPGLHRTGPWVAGLLLVFCLFSHHASAQNYPSRPISFVVPNLAGGSSDLIARALGAQLQRTLGQPVVIDNKPGASEMIATDFLARAPADGHTIAIFSNALAINETLSPNRRYDALRDLVPVAKLAELPFALIVRSGLPVKTVREFVVYAKANPGKLNYGHVGVGAPHYLTTEWFKRASGIDLIPVPFRSSPPLYTAMLGGEIQVTVGALGGAVQFIESGQVRALAAMSAKRPISQPQLPTISEAGFPEFDLVPWMGVFAPAGTPQDVVRKLETAILQSMGGNEIRSQLQRVGLEALPAGTAEFGALVKRDIRSWAAIVKELGVKIE